MTCLSIPFEMIFFKFPLVSGHFLQPHSTADVKPMIVEKLVQSPHPVRQSSDISYQIAKGAAVRLWNDTKSFSVVIGKNQTAVKSVLCSSFIKDKTTIIYIA